jgi:dTDP-4-amino-4,6-dideoxygalactose transaminase
MIVTDNESWACRAKYLTTQAKDDPVEYVHNEIGYNYRLTNMQAAMGVAQMEQLDDFVFKKRQIAAAYSEGLGDLQGFSLMPEAKFSFSTYWLYTVLHNMSDGEQDSRHLISELRERGIQSRPLWVPAHRQQRHQVCSFYGSGCADQLHRMALQLPSSVGITAQEIEYVISVLQAACVK